VALLEAVMPALGPHVVVDALATAYLTDHLDGLRHLGGAAVVTANPTETARMLDRAPDEVEADPLGATTDLARRTGAVVVHGGRDKTVVTPEGGAWLVAEGGSGLAVSGSGDVAAGIVAGLLARGADPAQAAVWGAWLHGSAGERLTRTLGPVGFLARELAAEVPLLLVDAGD
jgi:NAD(P)H-hydrate repair Nnr-like enzyme with NAD(P)H-hydrate dehydratase domain